MVECFCSLMVLAGSILGLDLNAVVGVQVFLDDLEGSGDDGLIVGRCTMAKQPGQKLKLLYLLDILREQTDEEHGLGLSQIQAMLQKQMRLEKQPDRKSLYSDFEELED